MVVAAAVVGLVVYGFVQVRVVQPSEPVASIGDSQITTAEFQGRVRLAQWNLTNQYANLQQVMQILGDDPETLSLYQNQLTNIGQQLANPLFVGSSILDLLIEEELIEQEAASRGIELSEGAVDMFIEESLGFFGEQEVATAQPGVDGTPSPTATPYTRELFESNFEAYLTNVGAYGIDEDTLRAEARAVLLRDLFEADFEDQVDETQEQVWARHILVDEEQEATDLLARIKEGEEWGDLAAEFSTDQSNSEQGGDLGWFSRGRMVEPFEEAAFDGEIGEIVGPIETAFGWHLIEILGHEDRVLDESSFRLAVSQALNNWIAETREIAEIEIFDYWVDRVPSPPFNPAG
ncbi:MAG: peptidylprolyl isomerase [Anaerolineales bacterium]